MAGGREHTDQDRFDLTEEARDFTRASVAGEPGSFEPSGTGIDAIIAALAAHADIDAAATPGRIRRGIALWASKTLLDEQRTFNRLVVSALEDLTTRLDHIEARVGALEPPGPADAAPPA